MGKKAAPQVDLTSPESQALLSRFSSLGLSDSRSKNVLQSSKSTSGLLKLLNEQPLADGLEEKQASLIVDLEQEVGYESLKNGEGEGKLGREKVTFLVEKIKDGKLKTLDQVKAAVAYLEAHASESIDKINESEFDASCGVGVEFTPESLLSTLESYIADLTKKAEEPKDWQGLTSFRANMKTGMPVLRWANGKDLTVAVEGLFKKLFGEKVPMVPVSKGGKSDVGKKKEPNANAAKPDAKKVEEAAVVVDTNPAAAPNPTSLFAEGFLSRLHKSGENPQISESLRAQHLAATGGRVFTRFPPEPNGYLHIGHAKAITIDFGYAKHHGGCCYLRFDDTNPDSEEGVYFDSILEMVRWLGFEPWKITYSSDNFEKLYEVAMKLTRKGLAFVCHCDQAAMAALKGAGRGNPAPCPHRDRSIEENVREFEAMKAGKYKEKGACLRLKIDLNSGNPYLWDPVAYRVKDTPHHRTGDKWKIYPTYDFTHPLCDSFENITHSLCTLEFVDARASYEWLCDAAEVYKPRQYETARLSLQGTFLSKRKIKKLVENKHVADWDDPRLFTLIALRRRGIPPAAMLKFVEELGVSLHNSETKIDRFEQAIRQTLELAVARLSLVLNPVKVTIANVPEDWSFTIEKPFHPKVASMGKYTTTVTKNVYIDQDDFRIDPPADFIRLSPGKSVILMGAPFPITCTDYKTDSDGKVIEIVCALEDGSGPNGDKKFKSKDAPAIHWVAQSTAVKVDEVRYFQPLFNSDDPSKLDDFEADINPDSLIVHKNAVTEPAFFNLAQQLITAAKSEAEKRTSEAAKFSQGHVDSKDPAETPTHEDKVTPVPHGADDTPVATASQLVGMECIRFQGMRLAYFTVDRESELGCLAGGEPALRSGDKIILNRIVTLKEDKVKKAT